MAEAIRQEVENRPERRGQAVVEPFGQEIDAVHLADVDIGADVEEPVGVEWLRDESQMRMVGAHVAEGESNERDICLAIVQVELEGDLRLEVLGGDSIVQKDGAVPGTVEERTPRRGDLIVAEAPDLGFGHLALLHSSAKSACASGSISLAMFHDFC